MVVIKVEHFRVGLIVYIGWKELFRPSFGERDLKS